jgi:HD domain
MEIVLVHDLKEIIARDYTPYNKIPKSKISYPSYRSKD